MVINNIQLIERELHKDIVLKNITLLKQSPVCRVKVSKVSEQSIL